MCLRYRSVRMESPECREYALQLLPLLPWVYFILVPTVGLTIRSSHISISHARCSRFILIFRLSLIHVSFSTLICRVRNTNGFSKLPLLVRCGPLYTLLCSLVGGWTGSACRLVHLEALGKEANLLVLSGSLFGHLILILHGRLNLNCNKSSL